MPISLVNNNAPPKAEAAKHQQEHKCLPGDNGVCYYYRWHNQRTWPFLSYVCAITGGGEPGEWKHSPTAAWRVVQSRKNNRQLLKTSRKKLIHLFNELQTHKSPPGGTARGSVWEHSAAQTHGSSTDKVTFQSTLKMLTLKSTLVFLLNMLTVNKNLHYPF